MARLKRQGGIFFNASHSVAYAMISYITTYLKYHYAVEFFCGWMQCSPKTDLRLLINDARSFDIRVVPPSIADVRDDFHIVDDNTIRFGFSGVQGCGAAQIEKIRSAIHAIEGATKRKIGDLSWLEFLAYGFYVAAKLFDINAELPAKGEVVKNHLSKSVIENLIKCGALDCFKQPRSLMLHELRQYKTLNPGEKKWAAENVNQFASLAEMVKYLRDTNKVRLDTIRAKDASKGVSIEKRYLVLNSILSLLEKPPVRVKDSVDDILIFERELLSVAISATKLDKYYNDIADTTIKQYLDGKNRGTVCIKCEISRLKPHEVKNPREDDEKDMAFISIIDDTGEMDDCVIFTSEFKDMRQKDLDYEGAQVLVWGEKDYKKGGFIIKQVRALA